MKAKRLLSLIILSLCSVSLMAQSRVYCEIVERFSFAKKNIKVIVDFGQKREKGKASQTLVDDKGEMIIYPSGNADNWLYCTSGSSNNSVRIGTNADNNIFEMKSVVG